ncbi:MAG: tRNA threonylcarbamoyladenosine dehydratase [Bacteroidales bacterium]|nr:tRNA threonylcarbamoyladenosine dehydratase [Bacteroidales bacterium]
MISSFEKDMLRRSELLLGSATMERIASARVIIFGVGGVGSWCAESLVRSGIRHLTIVDSDNVCITNCNRQLMATSKTIGQVKVDVLKERLLELNPSAEITAIKDVYCKETAPSFGIENYDFVIDAIDSLQDKADLIIEATHAPGVTLFSSMGAALRIDPTQVRAKEFWKIEGDGLARALRTKFKKQKRFPKHKFTCVCSEEVPMKNLADQELVRDEWSEKRAQVNGSLSPVTTTFGMTLASLVLKKLMQE